MSQMKNISFDGLQARLDEQLKYPSLFLFKFIAPLEKAQELVGIFAAKPGDHKIFPLRQLYQRYS